MVLKARCNWFPTTADLKGSTEQAQSRLVHKRHIKEHKRHKGFLIFVPLVFLYVPFVFLLSCSSLRFFVAPIDSQ